MPWPPPSATPQSAFRVLLPSTAWWRPGGLAAWRPGAVADVGIPDPQPSSAPLRVAPGEMWCIRCYEATAASAGRNWDGEALCPRCGSQRFVPATAVLRTDEYVVMV